MIDYVREFEKIGYTLYPVSGKTGEGVEALIEAVSRALRSGLDGPSDKSLHPSDTEVRH